MSRNIPSGTSDPVPCSFLAEEYHNTPAEKALFQVIPVPYEATVSYGGGTGAGPAAILEASNQLETFDGHSCPGDAGIHTWPAPDCSGDAGAVLSRVTAAVETALGAHLAGPVPVILGGEHSITAAALEGVLRHRQNRGAGAEPSAGRPRLGMIQIDAHADLRREYQGSRLSHACVARRVHEDLGVPVIQLGVRALSLEEVRYREGARERVGTDPSCPSLVWYDAAELVPGAVSQFRIPDDFPREIYLTIDVDGLDPSVCPATGTPVPGGLGWYQTLDLLRWIVSSRRIVAFDVVELAPVDSMHGADYTVAELTYRLMGMIQRSIGSA
jgi:agmatinase